MNQPSPIVGRGAMPTGSFIPIVISDRHVHLSQALIEQLFCDHYRLHVDAAAAHPRQFSALETVTLIGPTGRRIKNVRVIGPARTANQVEISRTDALTLEINAPVRESGDLTGTPGIIIEGPRARVTLGTGVICAQRHLHISPKEAGHLTLKDRECVAVSTRGSNRALLFEDVLVRVSPEYNLELHLDTDEANAAGLRPGDHAQLVTR